jgi:hypothetical protein
MVIAEDEVVDRFQLKSVIVPVKIRTPQISDLSTRAILPNAPPYCQAIRTGPEKGSQTRMSTCRTSGRYGKSSRNTRKPLAWTIPMRFARIYHHVP